MKRPISNSNQILMFLHCKLCMDELRTGKYDGVASPQTYAKYELGYTRQGLQVWCLRHDVNIIHIDFEGARHPANTSRKE